MTFGKKSEFKKVWDNTFIDQELIWLKDNIALLNESINYNIKQSNKITDNIDALLEQTRNDEKIVYLLKEYKDLVKTNKQEKTKRAKLSIKHNNLIEEIKKYPDDLVIPISKDKE